MASPYVRGPGGCPPPLPLRTGLLHLQERKREDCIMPKWGRKLAPRQPGSDISNWVVKVHVCEQRINGLPDRWRSAEWWILIERFRQTRWDGAESSDKTSKSLGRHYQVGTRFLGYTQRAVLMHGFAQQETVVVLFVRYPDRP